MPMLKINNNQFYYELHGQGDPLVLISGLKSDHTSWLPVLEKFSKDYQVLILDNRAIGRTVDDGKAFDVAIMADDVMDLIRSLNLKRPHIVGHSLGGAVAQKISLNYENEIQSITLCNTFMKFNDIGRRVFTDILKLYKDNKTQTEIMLDILPWVFSKEFITPEFIELIRKVSAENPYPQSEENYARQLQALYAFDSRQWVNKINLPTLVIGSVNDEIATVNEAKEIASAIKGSHLAIMQTGHGSLMEQPNKFIKLIQDFHAKLALNKHEELCEQKQYKLHG